MASITYGETNITTENKNTIQLIINTRTDDQYEQLWSASIPDHKRCSSYALFKHVRILEPFLSKLGTSNIIYLAQFRCRSNKLPIAKAYKPDMFYDTCTLCTKNETANEFHYLFICQYFHAERIRFVKKILHTSS